MTLHDVAVIGGQSHDVLAVLGHVQKLAAILVNVGYLKMIVRCRTTSRTTSHDIVRRRGSSFNICAVVVQRRRATSIYKIISTSHHVKSYVIVRLSHDYRTIYLWFSFSSGNHSEVVWHRTTIVRLSYDVVRFTCDFTDITDASQSHRVQCYHKTKIAIS